MISRNLLFAVVFAAASTVAGYRTYVINPPINDNPILEDEALPVECRDGTVMSVMCARGEYEPASFLVETDEPLKQVMVAAGPLQGAAGELPAGTVDIRIAQKFNMSITWTKETMPWVLVHDPGMMQIVDHTPKYFRELQKETVGMAEAPQPIAEYRAGHSKINKLLKELVDTDTLQPGDITDFRQFWITVHVPDDAPSGTYRSTLTITATNGPAKELTLEVSVPPFDLQPPRFHYGAYYPTMVNYPGMPENLVERYNAVTPEQYLAECRNMVEHGCTNPVSYYGAGLGADGEPEFKVLSYVLDIREKAGMPKGVPLFMFDGGGVIMKEGALTDEEKKSSTEATRKVVDWVRARGYTDACFMGGDELSGERLRSERDSFQAIRDGGGKIWVACGNDFLDIVGDLLDYPILAHPGALMVDQKQQWFFTPRDFLLHRTGLITWDPETFMMPDYQRSIKGAHGHGHKIFSYFDPQGGMPVPELHRRHRGLGMWKTGLDGTMTWAYIHIYWKTPHPDSPEVQDSGVPHSPNSFVVRGPEGPFDTLAWEGYREGCDDARYLATLQDAISKAKAAGKHTRLVARTERWLGDLRADANLDEWRREMARRTAVLLDD
jgi:hypothetical protein